MIFTLGKTFFFVGITSIYEYLEIRFKSKLVRQVGAATYILRTVLILAVTVNITCLTIRNIVGIQYWIAVGSVTILSLFFTIIVSIVDDRNTLIFLEQNRSTRLTYDLANLTTTKET